ncbi:MAG: hypothetical protein LBN99_06470, partial [Oscillospiraceae bacterium]|nr:hypothetical protein [Oscillospiraceae bacterium]
MKLIIGGAYQGKLDYVLGRFGYTRDDVHLCTMGEAALNTDKPVIRGLEKWIFAMLEAKRDPVAGIEELLPALRDRIVICTDLSGG